MPTNSDSIIVDTSCLILLSKINEISLLKLPGRNLFTTPQVHKEFKMPLPPWVEIGKNDLLALNRWRRKGQRLNRETDPFIPVSSEF